MLNAITHDVECYHIWWWMSPHMMLTVSTHDIECYINVITHDVECYMNIITCDVECYIHHTNTFLHSKQHLTYKNI